MTRDQLEETLKKLGFELYGNSSQLEWLEFVDMYGNTLDIDEGSGKGLYNILVNVLVIARDIPADQILMYARNFVAVQRGNDFVKEALGE
jgi:hypothetical protein